MRLLKPNIIELEKELSELDLFTLDFVRILRKHTNYVIVSGYVSILLGRARASEDIDIIIPRLEPYKFSKLLNDVLNAGFYCLNAESKNEIFDYLKNNFAARFAKNDTVIPNIELKFAKNKFDDLALRKTMKVKLEYGENKPEELVISHLELQIAFKEAILKSPKDLEDAQHLRNIAKKYLDNALIKKYEATLKNEFYRRK